MARSPFEFHRFFNYRRLIYEGMHKSLSLHLLELAIRPPFRHRQSYSGWPVIGRELYFFQFARLRLGLMAIVSFEFLATQIGHPRMQAPATIWLFSCMTLLATASDVSRISLWGHDVPPCCTPMPFGVSPSRFLNLGSGPHATDPSRPQNPPLCSLG